MVSHITIEYQYFLDRFDQLMGHQHVQPLQFKMGSGVMAMKY